MTPWPGAFCFLNNKRLKILSVRVLDIKANCEPATIVEASKNKLYVSTGDKDKVLSVLEIQPEGKKKLLIKDFLAGHKIEIGTKFS